MLDERAIARWIGSQLAAARKAKKKIRIEDIVQDAAEKFGKSDVTIRRPGNGSALLSGSVIQNDRNFPEVVTQRAAHAKA